MSNLASLLQSFRAFLVFRIRPEVKMTKRRSVFLSVVLLHLKPMNLGFHHLVVQKLPKVRKIYWNE